MQEVTGVNITPMPWETIPSLPHDESWQEIADHCFDHDPLPWRKKADNPRRVLFGTDHCYTYDHAALYNWRVFSSAGERLPDTEEASGSTPLTPTRGLVPYPGQKPGYTARLRRNYR